jgi:hypothetical protein
MQLSDKSLVLKQKSLMIVFGSGGHTSEMLMMIDSSHSNIFKKYGHIYFVIGHSDTWSYTKIKDYFQTNSSVNIENEISKGNLTIIYLFRAREIK